MGFQKLFANCCESVEYPGSLAFLVGNTGSAADTAKGHSNFTCSPVKFAKKSDHSAGVGTGADLIPERVFPGRSLRVTSRRAVLSADGQVPCAGVEPGVPLSGQYRTEVSPNQGRSFPGCGAVPCSGACVVQRCVSQCW